MENSKIIICKYSRRIRLPLGEVMFCKKRVGRKLPFPVPFNDDGDFCFSTRFKRLDRNTVNKTRVDVSRMYDCPYSEIYEK
jgi:hypothetical protein